MIKVVGLRIFFAGALCISLFVGLIKAEAEAGNQQEDHLQALEDSHYYSEDNAEDINLMSEEEFNKEQTKPIEEEASDLSELDAEPIVRDYAYKTINDVMVSGNNLISTSAILNYIPYRKGTPFDPHTTREVIYNLYDSLKRFKNIKIFGELVGPDLLNVHIVVEEKPVVKEIIFVGNKHLATKDIYKKNRF
jgi:surface antigen-like variable number repeat protein